MHTVGAKARPLSMLKMPFFTFLAAEEALSLILQQGSLGVGRTPSETQTRHSGKHPDS